MRSFRRPALFALSFVPVAAVAGALIALYQLDAMDQSMLNQLEAQAGGRNMVVLIAALQAVIYALACGFFGYILADKLGLMRSLRVSKGPLLTTLAISAAGGLIFSLDPWVFGRFIPGLSATGGSELTLIRFFASLLYGGIIEELMLRLFMMSLIAFIIRKLFCRSGNTPKCMLTAANIAAALLFAAGHLPGTAAMFGSITPIMLLRCFLLNGGFGIMFGVLYTKYGIHYAMISHAALHAVSQFIWLICA